MDAMQRQILEIVVTARNESAAALRGASAEVTGFQATLATAGKAMLGAGAAMGLVTAGLATGMGVLVKQAADFEELTTALVTGAGESKTAIDAVSAGILQMSGQVGVSADDLAKAMYPIESAGFHTAAGLEVLRASAEGAKVGMADQATVADGLTTVLKDYHLAATEAAGVTGQMVAAVAAGKMTFQDFSASLGKVLPIAAGLHISFQEVAAAEATLTAHGVDAAKAATAIQAGIMQLVHPSTTAIKSIKDLGISLTDLQTHLAAGDLTGTLAEFQSGIERARAAGVSQARIMSDVVAAFGGVKGGALALNLLPNMGEYQADVATIGTTQQGAAKLATGWALVQQDLNTQIGQFTSALQAAAIAVGQALLPVASTLLNTITPLMTAVTGWATAHRQLIAVVLIAATALSALITVLLLVGGTVLLLAATFNPLVGALVVAGALVAAWATNLGGLRHTIETVAEALVLVGIAFGVWRVGALAIALYTRANEELGLVILAVRIGLVQQALAAGVARLAMAAQAAVAVVTAGYLLVARAATVAWTLATNALTFALAMTREYGLALGLWAIAMAGVAGIVRTATLAWMGAQWLLNAALEANPLGLVIIAVAALTAGIVWAYQNVGLFRDAINLLGGALGTVGGWLKSLLGDAFGYVTDRIHDMLSMLGNFLSAVASLPGVSNLLAGVRSALAAAQGAASGALALPGMPSVPGQGGAVGLGTDVYGRPLYGPPAPVSVAIQQAQAAAQTGAGSTGAGAGTSPTITGVGGGSATQVNITVQVGAGAVTVSGNAQGTNAQSYGRQIGDIVADALELFVRGEQSATAGSPALQPGAR